MREQGGTTPEIPGFQPLHIRGAARLGIWIEARQIRLDRRVLLKVLPATDHAQQDQFVEEIQALVKLDGDGVLRVIDEGSVAQARYVALDEAEGRPVDTIAVKELDGDLLAKTLVKLHQQLHRQGACIDPVPLNSILLLPAGGFSVMELGPLEAQSDVTLCQEQAARNLARIGRLLRIQGRWSDAIRALRSGPGGFDRCLELFGKDAQKPRKPIPIILATAVAMSVGWVVADQFGWIDPAPTDPPPTDLTAGQGEEVSSTGDRDPADDESNPVVDQGDPPSGPIDMEALASRRWQRLEILEREAKRWPDWQSERDQLLRSLSWGQLSLGREQMDRIASAPEQAFASEREALMRAWAWVEERNIRQAMLDSEREIAAGRYLEAIDVLEKLARKLGLEKRFAADIDLLHRTEMLRREVGAQLELTMETVLSKLFQNLELAILQPPGVDRFPLLMARWSSFQRECQETVQIAEQVLHQAQQLADDQQVASWSLADGNTFEARVMDVTQQSVALKRAGRRNPETHPWHAIAQETLLALLDRDGADQERCLAALRTVWGGDRVILDLARAGGAGEIARAAERLRVRRVETWMEQGKQAQQTVDDDQMRSIALSVSEWVTASEWHAKESTLLRWWAAPIDRDGPAALDPFAGVIISDWDRSLHTIRIGWKVGDEGLSGWKPSPGAFLAVRGDLAQLRGRVALEAPFRFENTLEVSILGLVTREDAPNLNVVLWNGTDRGLVFGVGIRPPEVSSIRVGEEDVLLPAHTIIEEQALENGGGDVPMPAPLPRLRVGKAVRILIREDADGAILELDGSPILSAEPRDLPLIGGVAIETFGVPVVIRELELVGRISALDWDRWLLREAETALRRDR
ncbi:MAG: hypothetical protein VX949_08970 [Planctomycetota bacterium]|nr:hypothetical protein [Planctomycetota bacterium]